MAKNSIGLLETAPGAQAAENCEVQKNYLSSINEQRRQLSAISTEALNRYMALNHKAEAHYHAAVILPFESRSLVCIRAKELEAEARLALDVHQRLEHKLAKLRKTAKTAKKAKMRYTIQAALEKLFGIKTKD